MRFQRNASCFFFSTPTRSSENIRTACCKTHGSRFCKASILLSSRKFETGPEKNQRNFRGGQQRIIRKIANFRFASRKFLREFFRTRLEIRLDNKIGALQNLLPCVLQQAIRKFSELLVGVLKKKREAFLWNLTKCENFENCKFF